MAQLELIDRERLPLARQRVVASMAAYRAGTLSLRELLAAQEAAVAEARATMVGRAMNNTNPPRSLPVPVLPPPAVVAPMPSVERNEPPPPVPHSSPPRMETLQEPLPVPREHPVDVPQVTTTLVPPEAPREAQLVTSHQREGSVQASSSRSNNPEVVPRQRPSVPRPAPVNEPRSRMATESSTRTSVAAPQRYGYDGDQGRGCTLPVAFGYNTTVEWDWSNINPMFFKAAATDPDTLSFDQALADVEHLDKWKEAAEKEIKSLEDKETWEEVDISEATSKILPGTWVFRLKRTPDG